MRKVIDAGIYQDSIESNSLELLQQEEKRLYPHKKTKILKSRYGYKLWVYVEPAKGAGPTDPDALMLKEFKERLPDFRSAAVDFRGSLPKTTKTSATLYAAQLLDEYGPVARVKRAWRQLFSGKIQVAFVGSTVGTIGIAYTGKLTKSDRDLIAAWGGE